jgi:hypothetical protein
MASAVRQELGTALKVRDLAADSLAEQLPLQAIDSQGQRLGETTKQKDKEKL